MALEYPYVPVTVADGVDNVLASHHNHQEGQIDALTGIAYRRDNNKVVAVQGNPVAGSPIDVLTKVAMDTGKTIRARVGASGLIALSTTNGVGPVGTGIPTVIQRFTLPSLALMGCLTPSGSKTTLRLVLYENLEEVGWIDILLIAP